MSILNNTLKKVKIFQLLFFNFIDFLGEKWKDFKDNKFKILKERNSQTMSDCNPRMKKDMILKNSMVEEDEESDDLKGTEYQVILR